MNHFLRNEIIKNSMKGWVVFILGKVSKAWSKRALLTGGTGGYLGNMGVGEAVGYCLPLLQAPAWCCVRRSGGQLEIPIRLTQKYSFGM